jgi:surface carbohydrate biosynthesis protein
MENSKISHYKKCLYIPIETKVREFHGKLLFSLIAAENGFDVILGGQRELREQLHRFPRGIYIDKSVTVKKDKWFERCQRLGNMVTAWDEEGLLFFDNDMYQKMRLSEKALSLTRLFFAWGNVQKKAICEKYPEEEKKIKVTGNPRFDMLREEFRDFFKPEADTIAQKYGNIILVNTNFQLYNHFEGLEAARKAIKAYPIADSDPNFGEGWIDVLKRMFESFVEMLPKLSRSFPNNTIILRPHPSENHKVWQKLLTGLPNVRVIGEGNVIHWILASKVMIHFNCTTGVEAFLLNIPSIVFRPFSPGYYEQYLPNTLSIQAQSIEEVSEVVRSILRGENESISRQSTGELITTVKRYIEGYQGPLASDNIIAELKNLDIPDPYERNMNQRCFQLKQAFYWPLFKYYNKLTNPKAELYHEQKFPSLEYTEVQEAHDKLKEISGRFSDIKVMPVGRSCFKVFSI